MTTAPIHAPKLVGWGSSTADRRQRWRMQFSIRYLSAIVAIIALGVAVLVVSRPYDQVPYTDVLPFQIAITFVGGVVGLACEHIVLGTAIGFLMSSWVAAVIPIVANMLKDS